MDIQVVSVSWLLWTVPLRTRLCAQSLQQCPTLWIVALQASLSIEFSRQEYWSGLPSPLPGDRPNPGIELTSFTSPLLTGGFFTIAPSGKPTVNIGLRVTFFVCVCVFFLKVGNISFLFLFIWLCQVLAVAWGNDFSCGEWNLVPGPGIKPGPPGIGSTES